MKRVIPFSKVRGVTYTLSLGVYASAWAFYVSVGLAYQYGYGFLACYLGVSGAFLLAPGLLVVAVGVWTVAPAPSCWPRTDWCW